ncbi:molybdenum cofactor guanylyltransferase [Flavimobilis marinus]|uniref:Molybdopterin-guanine dinucleotide biosynthesis protein A n=1 Tax=Flavimobilis marinus TaxID=285351 RepID=A0A1I2D0C4_9MICO|nr:NTP transferase domain-containing protein [Flavimobilis marinus]GHG46573.1 molybdenum cofactor guanylyltransferase [Flavimobilis marinus]SFE73440.1 Molybdopterin-guanine dinucleotide biosynthesis protein A [Flavimobilis marinus]
MSAPTFDAVVLAGGTGRRLGGASKPDVQLEGRRLLDHALDATRGAAAVVVVAPETVAVPPEVRRTLESPPLGGPAAGIAAGLAALGVAREPAPLVLVLACDVPRAASAVPALVTATVGSMADGACLVDPAGRRQWLVGVYRRAALERRFAAAPDGAGGLGVGRLLEGLTLLAVPAVGTQALDVDTWGDLARLGGEGAGSGIDPVS